jgi:hypothetical protein
MPDFTPLLLFLSLIGLDLLVFRYRSSDTRRRSDRDWD